MIDGETETTENANTTHNVYNHSNSTGQNIIIRTVLVQVPNYAGMSNPRIDIEVLELTKRHDNSDKRIRKPTKGYENRRKDTKSNKGNKNATKDTKMQQKIRKCNKGYEDQTKKDYQETQMNMKTKKVVSYADERQPVFV
jgi:hypothetical protein